MFIWRREQSSRLSLVEDAHGELESWWYRVWRMRKDEATAPQRVRYCAQQTYLGNLLSSLSRDAIKSAFVAWFSTPHLRPLKIASTPEP
jgi:hypothetical protein